MDPNLFHLDWDRTLEALAGIVVLAFFVERALALLFEHRRFVAKFDESGLKEPIAFAVSAWVCWKWQFDAVSIVILADKISMPGILITGAVIAGGSKASVRLFQDLLKVRSDAVKEKKEREEAQLDGKTSAKAATVVTPSDVVPKSVGA